MASRCSVSFSLVQNYAISSVDEETYENKVNKRWEGLTEILLKKTRADRTGFAVLSLLPLQVLGCLCAFTSRRLLSASCTASKVSE